MTAQSYDAGTKFLEKAPRAFMSFLALPTSPCLGGTGNSYISQHCALPSPPQGPRRHRDRLHKYCCLLLSYMSGTALRSLKFHLRRTEPGPHPALGSSSKAPRYQIFEPSVIP